MSRVRKLITAAGVAGALLFPSLAQATVIYQWDDSVGNYVAYNVPEACISANLCAASGYQSGPGQPITYTNWYSPDSCLPGCYAYNH